MKNIFSKMDTNCTLCNESFKNTSLLEKHLHQIHGLGLPCSSSQGMRVRKRVKAKGIYKFL